MLASNSVFLLLSYRHGYATPAASDVTHVNVQFTSPFAYSSSNWGSQDDCGKNVSKIR